MEVYNRNEFLCPGNMPSGRIDRPEGASFAQPGATPWGCVESVSLWRPNGPTVHRTVGPLGRRGCAARATVPRALPWAGRTAGPSARLPNAATGHGRYAVTPRCSAYTLLEVILALALTTVILALVSMAMYIHFGVAEKSRGQVEEARLARTLLQHIADDLRNSIPFTPTAGTSTTASGTNTTSASVTSTTSDSGQVIPAGICGTAQCLQMDTTRRVRPVGMPKPLMGDYANCIPLADVKTVTYSLGNSGAATPGGSGDVATAAQYGLYRREVDRPAYVAAMQQGQSNVLSQATTVLAPEVVNVQFTYYDGTSTYDQWDSNTQGKLPIAIRVAIMIRHATVKSPNASATATADNSSFGIYDMLVALPNAEVQPSQGGEQSSGSPSSAGAGGGGSGGSSGGVSEGGSSGGGSGGGGGGPNR